MATDLEITDHEIAKKYRRSIELREQIEALREELSDIETDLGGAQGKKYAHVPGIGRFERYRTSAKTEWDSDSLRRQCIRAAREQRIADVNGEIIEDPVERTAYIFTTAAALDWRVGKAEERSGLAAFGIEADQYRQKSPGVLKVKLVAAEGGE